MRETVLQTLLCEDVAVRDTVLRTLLCEDVVAARYGAADAATGMNRGFAKVIIQYKWL